MNSSVAGTHLIVLPGGGYAEHAHHEAGPVASWLGEIGVQASVFRYPLNVRHPAPLDALRAEIGRRRAEGAQRIGLIGFSAGGHLAGLAALSPGGNAGSDRAVRCALLRHHLDGNRDIPSCPADPPGRERQPSAPPVDLAGFAGYPTVAALLHLAHRGGRVRPSRAHLPTRVRARGQQCSPRRAHVRPWPAQPRFGPRRRRGRDLDHTGERLDQRTGLTGQAIQTLKAAGRLLTPDQTFDGPKLTADSARARGSHHLGLPNPIRIPRRWPSPGPAFFRDCRLLGHPQSGHTDQGEAADCCLPEPQHGAPPKAFFLLSGSEPETQDLGSEHRTLLSPGRTRAPRTRVRHLTRPPAAVLCCCTICLTIRNLHLTSGASETRTRDPLLAKAVSGPIVISRAAAHRLCSSVRD